MITIRNGHFRLNDEDKPVYLRQYISKDWCFVRDIELKTYDDPWDESFWNSKVNFTRVAIVDKRVVGFWVANQLADYCAINRVAVHPRHQRKGIGSILLHDIEESFPELSIFRVLVFEYQESAFFALRKNGYEVVQNLGRIFRIPGVWEKELTYAFQKFLDR